MKKIFIALLTLVSLTTFAQTSTPRTGTAVGEDKTFRNLNCAYALVLDTAGIDSETVFLNAYQTIVKVNPLVDSVVVNFNNVKSCYLGDQVTFIVIPNALTGTQVVQFYRNAVTTGADAAGHKLRVGATHSATITFVFNGTKWVEKCRAVATN
jgi:hypothetical protein